MHVTKGMLASFRRDRLSKLRGQNGHGLMTRSTRSWCLQIYIDDVVYALTYRTRNKNIRKRTTEASRREEGRRHSLASRLKDSQKLLGASHVG